MALQDQLSQEIKAAMLAKDADRLSTLRLLKSAVGYTQIERKTENLTDADFIGDPAQRTGLYAFDQVRVQLIACPDTQSAAVTIGALAYCEQRGDAMFVGTTPVGFDLAGAKTYAAAFRGRKVYGAMYWPWIDVVNPLDINGNRPRVTIPPVGHVLGVYARIADYLDAFAGWNYISSIGSYVSGFGVLVFFFGLWQAFSRKERAASNPWGAGATTLEWTLPSPPPFHQYNELPLIK